MKNAIERVLDESKLDQILKQDTRYFINWMMMYFESWNFVSKYIHEAVFKNSLSSSYIHNETMATFFKLVIGYVPQVQLSIISSKACFNPRPIICRSNHQNEESLQRFVLVSSISSPSNKSHHICCKRDNLASCAHKDLKFKGRIKISKNSNRAIDKMV